MNSFTLQHFVYHRDITEEKDSTYQQDYINHISHCYPNSSLIREDTPFPNFSQWPQQQQQPEPILIDSYIPYENHISQIYPRFNQYIGKKRTSSQAQLPSFNVSVKTIKFKN